MKYDILSYFLYNLMILYLTNQTQPKKPKNDENEVLIFHQD